MNKAIFLILIFASLLVLDCEGNDEQAWVVLEFRTTDGEDAEMAFNNPQNPDITLGECEAMLPEIEKDLVEMAREKEPRLKGTTFVSSKCIMSATDPIKPERPRGEGMTILIVFAALAAAVAYVIGRFHGDAHGQRSVRVMITSAMARSFAEYYDIPVDGVLYWTVAGRSVDPVSDTEETLLVLYKLARAWHDQEALDEIAKFQNHVDSAHRSQRKR